MQHAEGRSFLKTPHTMHHMPQPRHSQPRPHQKQLLAPRAVRMCGFIKSASVVFNAVAYAPRRVHNMEDRQQKQAHHMQKVVLSGATEGFGNTFSTHVAMTPILTESYKATYASSGGAGLSPQATVTTATTYICVHSEHVDTKKRTTGFDMQYCTHESDAWLDKAINPTHSYVQHSIRGTHKHSTHTTSQLLQRPQQKDTRDGMQSTRHRPCR